MSKQDYRKWIIYKELNRHKRVTYKKLECLCNCTMKTLRKDIQELQENAFKLEEMPEVQISKGALFIEDEQLIPLNSIYLESMIRSPSYKLIHSVTEDIDKTIKQFCVHHYFSHTTVYKTLEKVNAYLCPFDLVLDRQIFVGDEYKIRIFLFNFYWTLFGGNEWPFKTISESYCKEVVVEVESLFTKKCTWIEREKISFWIAIVALRERNQEFQQYQETNMYWESVSESVSQLIKELTSNLTTNIVKKESSFLFVTLFLLCEEEKLTTNYLKLSHFNDSLSLASQEFLTVVSSNVHQQNERKRFERTHQELLKYSHYSQLGEAYVSFAMKFAEQREEVLSLFSSYPKLSELSNKQIETIQSILIKQKVLKEKVYPVFIGAKYGESEMEEIKSVMEALSPDYLVYLSLWPTIKQTESVDIILTDLKQLPVESVGIKIQFYSPFDKNQANESLKQIKKYVKSKKVYFQ